MSLLWRLEVADMTQLPVQLDLGSEAPSAGANAKQAGRAVSTGASTVLLIDRTRNVAEVGESVVLPITVDMVNLIGWQGPVDIQPNDAGHRVSPTVNNDDAPAIVMIRSGRADPFASSAPAQTPGSRIVKHQASNSLLGQDHEAGSVVTRGEKAGRQPEAPTKCAMAPVAGVWPYFRIAPGAVVNRGGQAFSRPIGKTCPTSRRGAVLRHLGAVADERGGDLPAMLTRGRIVPARTWQQKREAGVS